MDKSNKIDFSKQPIFIGIDVHKRNWSVTTRTSHIKLKTFSMNPSPQELAQYMTKKYPGAEYHSVYEAGYSGFWIHKELQDLGFHNIVINPADVPTTDKEKKTKTDPVDSAKLARELAGGSLKPLYVPDEFHQQLRSLCRLRYTTVQNQTRAKNRIKALLSYYGIALPKRSELNHWSNNFVKWLDSLEFTFPMGKESLDLLIEGLLYHRHRLVQIIRSLRKYIGQYGIRKQINYLLSVPGVGFSTAVTLYCELIDINRFPNLDHLASYVGLIPSTRGSGETVTDRGITKRHNTYLSYLLVEAAWIAVRNDPALTLKFSKLIGRMKKQRAIIHIAKKLLNRIRYVWKNEQYYVPGIIV